MYECQNVKMSNIVSFTIVWSEKTCKFKGGANFALPNFAPLE
jgi:hypothetical protein